MSTRRRFDGAAVPYIGEPHRPAFELVVDRENPGAEHVFSVCLYHEPEFALRFPSRVFERRYLAHQPQVRELFERCGFHLRIFADQAMLETALGLGFGSLYLVTEPPPFPFAQHLWRYYSVLLPGHKCHHFRGLDNLLVNKGEIRMLRQFASSGADILHAPYMRARGRVFMPVRGSCSVSRGGIVSLAKHLLHRRQTSFGPWPEDWHCDERWLGVWLEAERHHSSLYTLVDREMPAEFFVWLQDQLKHDRPGFMVRTPGRGIMSSAA